MCVCVTKSGHGHSTGHRGRCHEIAYSVRPGHLEKYQTFTVLAQRSAQTGNGDDQSAPALQTVGGFTSGGGTSSLQLTFEIFDPLQNTGDFIDTRQRMFNAFPDFLESFVDTGRGELRRNIEICN